MFDEFGHERLMYIYIKDSLIIHPISDDFSKHFVSLESASLYTAR